MLMKEDEKLANVQQNFKKKCKHCGHSMTFYKFEKDRKICSYCGKFNYKNKEAEKKYTLIKLERYLKRENNYD